MHRPNILFLFPDQWRWDFLGCGGRGIPVRTPTADALARRGVRFEQCRTNSPLCAPARASLIQGVPYERCGVPNNKVNCDPARPNFVKQLRQSGYWTTACGKLDLFKPERFRGLEGWTQPLGEMGFDRAVDQSGKLDAVGAGHEKPMDAYSATLHSHGLMETHRNDYARRREAKQSGRFNGWPTPLPREAHTDEFTARNALRLLEESPDDRPWFLWVNFPGPHDPFDPPAEFLSPYEGVNFPPPLPPAPTMSPDDVQSMRRSYAACCTHVDALCGRIIDAVRQRGDLDNTVIILASDHGEMLGDRGIWGKAVPYESALRVPLIITGPGIPAGAPCGEPVELCDLAATICELAGAAPIPHWDSISLLALLQGREKTHRHAVHSALDGWSLEIVGNIKTITHRDAPTESYDVASDHAEINNLNPDIS